MLKDRKCILAMLALLFVANAHGSAATSSGGIEAPTSTASEKIKLSEILESIRVILRYSVDGKDPKKAKAACDVLSKCVKDLENAVIDEDKIDATKEDIKNADLDFKDLINLTKYAFLFMGIDPSPLTISEVFSLLEVAKELSTKETALANAERRVEFLNGEYSRKNKEYEARIKQRDEALAKVQQLKI